MNHLFVLPLSPFSKRKLCTTTSHFAMISFFSFIYSFLPFPGSEGWSPVSLWWNEVYTKPYKPGRWQRQLKSHSVRAPNGLTLQFPPQWEIGRTEVGIIKTTSLGKSDPFFTQHWLRFPFHRQDHFLLTPWPLTAKREACFPSINCCTHSFAFEGCYVPQFPFSTCSGPQVCAFYEWDWEC